MFANADQIFHISIVKKHYLAGHHVLVIESIALNMRKPSSALFHLSLMNGSMAYDVFLHPTLPNIPPRENRHTDEHYHKAACYQHLRKKTYRRTNTSTVIYIVMKQGETSQKSKKYYNSQS